MLKIESLKFQLLYDIKQRFAFGVWLAFGHSGIEEWPEICDDSQPGLWYFLCGHFQKQVNTDTN